MMSMDELPHSLHIAIYIVVFIKHVHMYAWLPYTHAHSQRYQQVLSLLVGGL